MVNYLFKVILSNTLFPTRKQDWYVGKGYGTEAKDAFQDFVDINSDPKNKNAFIKNMSKVSVERSPIKSQDVYGNEVILDSVKITPKEQDITKAGDNRHLIKFFGRGEYYESRWNSLIESANRLGTTVHAFNYIGQNSSSGQLTEFNDLVNSGISMVNKVLENPNVSPDDIILESNSFGGQIMEAVAEHFHNKGIKIRHVNGNSFSALDKVVTEALPVGISSLLKDSVKDSIDQCGWNYKPYKGFGEVGPYAAYMVRQDDRTIREKAGMHYKVKDNASNLAPDFAKGAARLKELAVMVPKNPKNRIDSHKLSLDQVVCKADPSKDAYDFMHEYIDISNNYVNNHKQQKPSKLPEFLGPREMNRYDTVIYYDMYGNVLDEQPLDPAKENPHNNPPLLKNAYDVIGQAIGKLFVTKAEEKKLPRAERNRQTKLNSISSMESSEESIDIPSSGGKSSSLSNVSMEEIKKAVKPLKSLEEKNNNSKRESQSNAGQVKPGVGKNNRKRT
jgi:hypothetical protein